MPTQRQQQPLVAAALARTRGAFTGVAFVSAVTNLLMLTGPLFMLQIYDRVLSSRSVPTLVALTALVAGLYLFLGVLEIIRARVLTRIGQRVDRDLSGPAFDAGLNLPLKTRNSEAAAHPMRDLDRIRQFMAGQGLSRSVICPGWRSISRSSSCFILISAGSALPAPSS